MAGDLRSASFADRRREMVLYGSSRDYQHRQQPPSDFSRSYSARASYVYSHEVQRGNELGVKGKSSAVSSSFRMLTLSDPEMQRKKRVASYKAYSIEGKLKGSFRKSFRWIKDKYNHWMYESW